MGGGTVLISLPKGWATKNGIRKGSAVAVEELGERKLVVRPIEDVVKKPRDTVVDYPREDVISVINDVTGAYLLGYDVIKVQGKNPITREDRQRLKLTIGRLIGLEIMDEDSKQMTLQFLLERTMLNPERLARRMVSIIDGMLRDAVEGLSIGDRRLLSLVGERDDEVDRLYFLLVRTIRTATGDPEVGERYALTPVDILDYRVLASYLESVGDTVAEFTKNLADKMPGKTISKGLARCLDRLQEMEGLAIQSFLNRRSRRERGVYSRINAISKVVTELSSGIAELPESKTADSIGLLGLIERASKLFVDITDLAAPSYPIS